MITCKHEAVCLKHLSLCHDHDLSGKQAIELGLLGNGVFGFHMFIVLDYGPNDTLQPFTKT